MGRKEIHKTDMPDFTETIKSAGAGGPVPTSKVAAGMLRSSWHQALGGGEGSLPDTLAMGTLWDVFCILCHCSTAVLFSLALFRHRMERAEEQRFQAGQLSS